MKTKIFYFILFGVTLIALAVIPGKYWQLPCPLYQWTGWQCPFCGGQRMIQALLHGEFMTAFKLNPLLICSIPLMLLALFRFFFPRLSERHPRITGEKFFTDKALFIYLFICFLWGIIRNMEKFYSFAPN